MSSVDRRQQTLSGPTDPATADPATTDPATTDPATADPATTGIDYDPHPDGRPDPGEVVWGWVAYEDDPSQGKDRPILLLGRQVGAGAGDDEERWLGLMLTSKDHDRDAEQEARAGRHWMDVGSGAWDREGRPSEVRLDRLLVLEPDAIRREGAALDRGVFDQVVAAARELHALPD